MADLCCKWAFKTERPGTGLEEQPGNAELNMTETVHILYQELCKYGYVITELYDLTLAELMEMLEARKKGQAYEMWKLAGLHGLAMNGKEYPETPEKASPELYPPKKRYKMPEFLKEWKARKEGT